EPKNSTSSHVVSQFVTKSRNLSTKEKSRRPVTNTLCITLPIFNTNTARPTALIFSEDQLAVWRVYLPRIHLTPGNYTMDLDGKQWRVLVRQSKQVQSTHLEMLSHFCDNLQSLVPS